ncbi:MAG TPA: hypothetical protein VLH56_19375 [Dissulfurispiraceae bacterium]|nr:hypothetical protein [Dissulfurispiraceae bacterium]
MAKADGSLQHWNPIEQRALKLGPVWIALLMICEHPTGVWELSLGKLVETVWRLSWRDLIQPNSAANSVANSTANSVYVNSDELVNYVTSELDRLESASHLKRYTDGSIWLKDRWSYNKFRNLPSNQRSAYRWLSQYSCALADFLAHDESYNLIQANSTANSPPISGPNSAANRPNIKNKNKNIYNTPNAPNGAQADKVLTSAQEQLVPLATKLSAIIAKGCELHGMARAPTNHPAKSARVLDQIIRLDKIPADSLVRLTEWIMWVEPDRDSWRLRSGTPEFDNHTILASIPAWRSPGKNKQPKILNAYNRWPERFKPVKPPADDYGRASDLSLVAPPPEEIDLS